VLQNGIYIDNIPFENIKAKKLYIKWNEKISIVIKELDIDENKNDNDTQLSIEEVDEIIKSLFTFKIIFEKVLIEELHVGSVSGSFKYVENGNGFLKLSSDEFVLDSTLFFEEELLNIHIDSLKDEKYKISLDGNVILNTKNKTELNSKLHLNFNNEAKLVIYLNSGLYTLRYKIETTEDIKSIKGIVDTFAPDFEAKYWVYDAIEAKGLQVVDAHGWFKYKKTQDAIKNLYVKAIAKELNYKYDEKLAAIDTKYTDLIFKNSQLYIYPRDAYTYNMFLDKSWLKIDFSQENFFINLSLDFTGKLNQDILDLLSHYGVDLPLIQTKGKLKTDLQLDINLNNLDVEAHGTFYTNNSWIKYLGMDIHAFKTKVELDNTKVKVTNMYAEYDDLLKSHLDINFDASKGTGVVDFRVDDAELKILGVKLAKHKEPLRATYTISNKQDYIYVEKSRWEFDNDIFDVDAMKLPFYMQSVSTVIPPTRVESEGIISAIVAGEVFFKPIKANLDLDIVSLKYYNTTLNQQQLDLNVNYANSKTIIQTDDDVSLKTAKDIYEIKKGFNIAVENGRLNVNDMRLFVGNFLKSNISMFYNLNKNSGYINLENIDVSNDTFHEIFKKNDSTRLSVKNVKDEFIIESKEYGVRYILNDYEWRVRVDSIAKIAQKSSILKRYFVDNGSFRMGKKYNENHIKYFFKTDYKYTFLVKDNEPVTKYYISGRISTKNDSVKINVNDKVQISIEDTVKIRTKKAGLFLNQITAFLADLEQSEDENATSKLEIDFDAQDSYVYISKKRHAISDNINFIYKNDELVATLKHKKGLATFKYNDGNFSLDGKGFNDEFMNELFALTDMKGGSLGFSISGPVKEYGGVVYVRDSTMIDYKVLNNVLAFINTVPALVTFSLPGYNQKGLHVDRLYFDFKYKDDVYDITGIAIDSKELKITGKGKASIKNNTIDMDVTLKTDIGSSVSKIPVVGYILLGKDTVSTTLKLDGRLDDPTVHTNVSKEIIVAPWNIIKRTITYPMQLFGSDNEDSNKE
jgi:hypothetical protein